MQDKPTGCELITAVAQFLQSELAPALTDPRLKFRALVAANVLSIVGRELDMSDTQLGAERARLQQLFAQASHHGGEGADNEETIESMTRALAQMIRAGQADQGTFHDAVFAHVEQTVIEKLQIANPKYLERVRQETR